MGIQGCLLVLLSSYGGRVGAWGDHTHLTLIHAGYLPHILTRTFKNQSQWIPWCQTGLSESASFPSWSWFCQSVAEKRKQVDPGWKQFQWITVVLALVLEPKILVHIWVLGNTMLNSKNLKPVVTTPRKKTVGYPHSVEGVQENCALHTHQPVVSDKMIFFYIQPLF